MLKTVRRYVLALSAAVIGFLASFGAQEANAQYCYPGSFGSCVGYDYNTAVFKVTLGALSNSTACTGIFTYYTTPQFQIIGGSPTTLTLNVGFPNGPYWIGVGGPGYVYCWIDLNMNNVYEASEVVLQGQIASTPLDISTTLTLATNLTPGLRRMRIKTNYYNDGGDPCGYTYGETEEYDIMVLPPLADGSPTSVALIDPATGNAASLPARSGTYDLGFTLSSLSAVPMTKCQYDFTVSKVSDGSILASGVNRQYTGPLASGATTNLVLATGVPVNNPLAPLRVRVTVKNVESAFAVGDNNNNNNVLDAFVGPALDSGAYYIGGTPTPTNWFSNPNDAAVAVTYGGVLGPVTFNTRPGAYDNTQMNLGQVSQTVNGIPGATPTNKVVFKADPANPGTIVFQAKNNAAYAVPDTNYIVLAQGNVYTDFIGITFQANPLQVNSRLIWMKSTTRSLNFTTCEFNGLNNINTGVGNTLVHSESGNAFQQISFIDNKFNNGDNALFLDAGFSAPGASGLTFTGNTISNFYSQGIFVRGINDQIINRNTITTNSVNAIPVFGINSEFSRIGGQINNNRISFNRTGSGIRLNTNFADIGSPTQIFNNMVIVGNGTANTTFGLTASSFTNTNIYFNTFIVNAPVTTLAAAFNCSNASSVGTRVVNNLFHNTGAGYAYSITSGSAPLNSDFNNLWNSTTLSAFSSTNLAYANFAPQGTLSAFRTSIGSKELSSTASPVVFFPGTAYVNTINASLRGTQTINNIASGNTNVDVDNTLRRNPPLKGAHELVPIVSYAAPAFDSTCFNRTTVLNANPTVTTNKPAPGTVIANGNTFISYTWESTTSRDLATPGKFVGFRTSILTINNTDEFDQGTYTCTGRISDGALESNGVDPTVSVYKIDLKINQPVEIQRQPISQVVCKGKDVVLNFTTKRGTTLGYEWFKDGEKIRPGINYPFASSVEGADNYVLILRNVDFTASGRYMCKIKTACGAQTSDSVISTLEAVVYVAKGTQIDKEPISQVVAAGATAKFEIAAAEATTGYGISPVQYQWFRNNALITDNTRYSGANSPVLKIARVSNADAGNYSVKIIGACGEATSQIFTLSLGTVSVNVASANIKACEGSMAKLSAVATPSVAGLGVEYAWYKGTTKLAEGTKYTGTNSANLMINNVSAADAAADYNVQVMATPAVDVKAKSSNIDLSLNAPTVIGTSLDNKTVCEGTKHTMSVAATGEGTLSYAWTKDGAAISNTSSSLDIATMDAASAGRYAVTVTGTCGSVTSTADIAFLTKPVIVVSTKTTSIKQGSKLELGVSVNTTGNTTFRWFFGSKEVTNDTINRNFVKYDVTTADAGKYRCEVTNECGTTVSEDIDVLITPSTSVNEAIIAEGLKLFNNEPNPFATGTAIRFELPKTALVNLTVSDIFGREVASLASSQFEAGMHTVNFVPSEFNLTNGVYYYTLTTSGTSLTQKMLFVK